MELPDSSELTREDLTASRWRAVLGDSRFTDTARVYVHLHKASEQAHEDGDLRRAKVLKSAIWSSLLATVVARLTPAWQLARIARASAPRRSRATSTTYAEIAGRSLPLERVQSLVGDTQTRMISRRSYGG